MVLLGGEASRRQRLLRYKQTQKSPFRLAVAFCFCLVVMLQWRFRPQILDETQMLTATASFLPRHSTQSEPCAAKQTYLTVLREAGLPDENITQDLCERLPSERQVAELYGSGPVIHGLDQCQAYQSQLFRRNGERLIPRLRVTGLWNTGTNAMERALGVTLEELENGAVIANNSGLWDVPWKKHFPIQSRDLWVEQNDPDTVRQVLTIVLVRDPFHWMQSMCKASYTVEWKRVRGHCPNLVPSLTERRARPGLQKAKSFRVVANFGQNFTLQYESLARLWSEWNRQYYVADFARLFIRLEDMVFHGAQVMQQIAACAGLSLSKPYRAMLQPSKDHGDSSGLVTAMIRYGTSDGRWDGMLPDDVDYAKQALDEELMRIFQYRFSV